MGGYFKGNLGKREKPGEYQEEYLSQFIPTCLQFCTQKGPIHRITQLLCAHGDIPELSLYWDSWQGRGRRMLNMGEDFWTAQKYLFKILNNTCCTGGMAQWGRWSWLYFQTNWIKGEGTCPRRSCRSAAGERRLEMLSALHNYRCKSSGGRQNRSLIQSSMPNPVLVPARDIWDLSCSLSPSMWTYVHTHTHTLTCSLPSRLPQIFEGFTYLCTFRTESNTILTPENIFSLLHYNFYLLLLAAVHWRAAHKCLPPKRYISAKDVDIFRAKFWVVSG